MTVMGTINKMNVADCHAPWQTPHDWYLVGGWEGGDGCDFVVVQGWAAVVSKWCQFFISGTTIQDAIDKYPEMLISWAEDWADSDKWTTYGHGPRRYDCGIGEIAQGEIIILTDAPKLQLPALDEGMVRILGMPNFQCAPYARALRDDGMDILERSENEQAHVLHWLLGIYLKDPANYADSISNAIGDLVARVKAKGVAQ